MWTEYISPLVGAGFVVLALIQVRLAARVDSDGNGTTSFASKVHKKLSIVFLLVGIGLIGFYLFTR